MSTSFNPNFSKFSEYNPEANIELVKFGADAPLTEMELNELQLIQNKRRKDLIKSFIGNGLSKDGDIVVNSSNVLSIRNKTAYIDGYQIFIDQVNIQLTPNSKVYLNVFETEATIDTQLKKHGNVQGSDTTNNIKDSRYEQEISRRIVVNYELSMTKKEHSLEICSVGSNVTNYTIIDNEISIGGSSDGTKLIDEQSKLPINVGEETKPVYFKDGVPEGIVGLDIPICNSQGEISITNKKPVTLVNGRFTEIEQVDIPLAENNALLNKGSIKKPVFFSNGRTEECSEMIPKSDLSVIKRPQITSQVYNFNQIPNGANVLKVGHANNNVYFIYKIGNQFYLKMYDRTYTLNITEDYDVETSVFDVVSLTRDNNTEIFLIHINTLSFNFIKKATVYVYYRTDTILKKECSFENIQNLYYNIVDNYFYISGYSEFIEDKKTLKYANYNTFSSFEHSFKLYGFVFNYNNSMNILNNIKTKITDSYYYNNNQYVLTGDGTVYKIVDVQLSSNQYTLEYVNSHDFGPLETIKHFIRLQNGKPIGIFDTFRKTFAFFDFNGLFEISDRTIYKFSDDSEPWFVNNTTFIKYNRNESKSNSTYSRYTISDITNTQELLTMLLNRINSPDKFTNSETVLFNGDYLYSQSFVEVENIYNSIVQNNFIQITKLNGNNFLYDVELKSDTIIENQYVERKYEYKLWYNNHNKKFNICNSFKQGMILNTFVQKSTYKRIEVIT